MNKEWLKFTAGVIGFVAVALLISYVIQSPAQAEMDSIRKKSRHGQSDRRYSERGYGDSGPGDRVG
jgi:glucose uptake protein GlcU